MAITPLEPTAHPVLRSLAGSSECLTDAHETSMLGMSAPETGVALEAAFAQMRQLNALVLKLISHGEGVGLAAEDATTSMAAWLREHALTEPREARGLVKLAGRMCTHEPTAQALAAGEIPVASAAVIVTAVDALPRQVGPELRERAEEHLVLEARVNDTGIIRAVAKHLEDVLDPEGADARLGKLLEAAEAKATRSCFLTMRHDEVNAMLYGTFALPLITGVKLLRQVEAHGNPRRPDPIPFEHPDGVQISADERRGLAFCQLIDSIPKRALPKSGGCEPLVVVTMRHEHLLDGLGVARLDTGHRISASLARRLAAQHGIIPAVLGGDSEVLDLGRKARLASRKQRLALNVEQRGCCGAEGCDSPAAWADANHLDQWSKGGRTDLQNLILLCKRHHQMADNPGYRVTRVGPGRIRINRRT